jgi:hypothetical protein
LINRIAEHVVARLRSHLFAITNTLTVAVVIDLGVTIDGAVGGVVDGIADIADGFLGFALDLLCCTIYLGLGVTGPLANLALGTACCVIHCAFNFVAIHISTSVGRVELRLKSAHLRARFPDLPKKRGARVALKCGSASRDQLDHQNNESEHEQNMDESTHGVAAYEAEQPQNEKDHENCPEHNLPPETLHICTTATWTPP